MSPVSPCYLDLQELKRKLELLSESPRIMGHDLPAFQPPLLLKIALFVVENYLFRDIKVYGDYVEQAYEIGGEKPPQAGCLKIAVAERTAESLKFRKFIESIQEEREIPFEITPYTQVRGVFAVYDTMDGWILKKG